jgi:nitroreductase
MDIMEAILHRRATRDYTMAGVDDETLDAVVAAAVQAPNAMNRQPWSFVIVKDRAILDHCAERAKADVLAGLEANSPLAHYREHLAAHSFHIFYNAPALVVICATEADEFARHDCCLAAQNLMLAAHAKGLGTCWIGFAESWLNKPEGKNELGIPANHVAVAPIIIGHPAAAPSAPPRRPPEIIWFEP